MSEHEDHSAPTEPLPGTPKPTATQAGPKASAPAPIPTARPARFGTILWGVVLLVFAAAMFTSTIAEVRIDPLTWITGGLIATGAVLVLAGIAAAVRRRP